MRRYASSKIRLAFLLAMIAVMAVAVSRTYAQGEPAAAGATPAEHPKGAGVMQLVLNNMNDPIFWIIGVLSVIGCTLIVQGVIKNRASVLMPEATVERIREMVSNRQFKELIEFTENDNTFISKALNPALKRAPSFASMKEAMETSLSEQTADQFRKIEYLNIIGNLGPLLGLAGTVLGMIDAFQAMNAAGGAASPAALADGISKALTHTFLGLMLAVPCLAAFGVLRTVVDRLTVRGSLIAEELLLMIKPADSKPAAKSAPVAAPPVPATRRAVAPPAPAV